MKKTISIFMLGIAVMLASCSQDEDALQTGSGEPTTVTFTATLDGSMTQRAMKTRAVEDPTDGTITRAVLEIYENGLKVGDRITQTVTDESNITFTAELEAGKQYYCLFWADGGEDTYNIGNLTDIKRGTNPSIAYYAEKEIQAQSGTENVTLTHAVAKMILFETGTLAKGDQVGVSFDLPEYAFNVTDGSCSTEGATITVDETFEIDDKTSGQVGSLYVFAPAAGTDLTTVTLSYTPSGGSEETTQASNVPLKMNHRTVLKGAFATIDDGLITQNFNVTLDKNWEGNSETATVGDYYYEGGWFSDTYDSSLTCLGVVFEVDAEGRNGKVVSLAQTTGLAWSIEDINTGADALDDGVKNMTAIRENSDLSNYPAFQWCAGLGEGWYLPAYDELTELYRIYNAGSDAFNLKLTTAGGAAFTDTGIYWTSTENDKNSSNPWYVQWELGGPGSSAPKSDDSCYIRAILKFSV